MKKLERQKITFSGESPFKKEEVWTSFLADDLSDINDFYKIFNRKGHQQYTLSLPELARLIASHNVYVRPDLTHSAWGNTQFKDNDNLWLIVELKDGGFYAMRE